ncbi:MAG: hypothetical protein NT075_08960 [Chloroflexi bacterium]|nr:hypothetical protein [Chloroflexota bacterium]
MTVFRSPGFTPTSTPRTTDLVQSALQALATATTTPPSDEKILFIEERSVWEPTSWLIQCCWAALAKAGAGDEALSVARLAALRQPLAALQVLHQLAQQAEQSPALTVLVRNELAAHQSRLLESALSPAGRDLLTDDTNQIEGLLLGAASAALIGDLALAGACLDRLDQSMISWRRIMDQPEWRALLAESVAYIGLQAQTEHLIQGAVRRFDDAGVQFLHQVASLLTRRAKEQLDEAAVASTTINLLAACVETLRDATLTNLQSRRLAVTVLAQAGMVDDLLAQLTIIANLLTAQRDSGINRQSEGLLLRQVKRPKAKPDIDFQVYTLQEAVAVMPIQQIAREQRIGLAEQLAWLGTRSDGWTAAGAAASLIQLGAVEYAVNVVDKIAPNDPTRSEGTLALVRGLLAAGEPVLAATQVNKALAWARTQAGRNPERAITWGLAEIYLKQGEPERALQLLNQWRTTSTSLLQRLRTMGSKRLDDDALRNQSLRLQALLQLNQANKEIQTLFTDLATWAPRLLDGEALINFYVQGLLQPLLNASRYKPALGLLPQLHAAMGKLNGHKHAVRVAEVTTLLAQPLAPTSPLYNDPATRDILTQFLVNLWQASAQRGIWQVVHSIEGSLPLLLALEGPQAAVEIARSVADY